MTVEKIILILKTEHKTNFMKPVILSLIFLLGFCLKALTQPYAIGNTTISFIDPDRNNRAINTAVYYPAISSGQNTPVASGQFPVIVFGHGFVMVHTAYQYLWTDLVPEGYILAFPTTEGSFSPSHLDFGLDLAFLIEKMKTEGQNPSSLFYNAVAETSAVMGHSMGGGASFLACNLNQSPTTMVTFAAANTNPSAIGAASGVTIPTLLFAGQNDCVTPPPVHQYPLYEATASQQKVLIEINGGGHCYFADYNLFCAIGEGSCSPSPSVTRQQQQNTTLDFLHPWFDFLLKNNISAWQIFMDSLQSSSRISHLIQWNAPLPPTGLNVSDITGNSAMLSWTPSGFEDHWDILWGSTGFDPGSQGVLIEGVTTHTYLLEGLAPATSYDFFVRSVSGSGMVSNWSGPLTFLTLISTMPGDADCDGMVNILDVITIINYIVGSNPEPFCPGNADVNQDGSINVLDAIGTTVLIVG